MRPPPAHRVTTAHLQAAYPFLAEGGLGDRGVYIGRDLFGGSFCHDPWELYRRGLVTGPNMIVLGQIGRGKSSFIKTYLWRSQVFGRQAWVVDPKGEYGPVAEASGTRPLRIGPGLGVRLNPLDPGSSVRGAAGGDAGVALAAGAAATGAAAAASGGAWHISQPIASRPGKPGRPGRRDRPEGPARPAGRGRVTTTNHRWRLRISDSSRSGGVY